MILISKILVGIIIVCMTVLIIGALVIVYDMVLGLKLNISKNKVLLTIAINEIAVFIAIIILSIIEVSMSI